MKKIKTIKVNYPHETNYFPTVKKSFSNIQPLQKNSFVPPNSTDKKRTHQQLTQSPHDFISQIGESHLIKLNSNNPNQVKKYLRISIKQEDQKIIVKKFYYSNQSSQFNNGLIYNSSKKRVIQLNTLNSFKTTSDNSIVDMLNPKILFEELNANQATLEESIIPKIVSCNCKKSKCLKLYCQCFSKGDYCSQTCSCSKCANNIKNQDQRKKARLALQTKNSNYSKNKSQKQLELIKYPSIKGCNCKKSGCNKKYCQCYNSGQKCSSSCSCKQCKNKMINQQQEIQLPRHYQGNGMKFDQIFDNNMVDFNEHSKIFNRKEQSNLNFHLNLHDLIMEKQQQVEE